MAKERPSEKPGDFQQLLRQAIEGNRKALGELLNSFRELLRLYGIQHFPKELKGKADVSDLIQDSLSKALQTFRRFQGESKGELAAWLQAIMRHVIASYLRNYHRGKRDVRLEVPLNDWERRVVNETGAPFLGEERTEEEITKFRTVFSQLPELYRAVLFLRKQQGLTYKQIAARVGGTAEGARKLFERAVKKFREEWEKRD